MNQPSSADTWRAEQVVLLACARNELAPAQVSQIGTVVGHGIDWDALWHLACSHGVGYFVGRHLQQLSQNQLLTLPESFVNCLRKDLWAMNVQARVLLEYQQRLALELEGHDILWLKGLALSTQLYGRPEARASSDLDLLVALPAIVAVEESLRRLGLERWHSPVHDLHPMGAHHSQWYATVGERPVLVEMHQRFSGPAACQPDVAGLMQRSRTMLLEGTPMRVPSLEDELLILCLHGHHHNFGFLRCLMDVAEYAKRYHDRLDWARFRALAHEHHGWGRANAAFTLAEFVLGLDRVPPIFPWKPRMTLVQRWATGGVTHEVLLDKAADQDDFLRVRLGLLMDRWSDIVRLIGPHLFPSRRYLRAVYPGSWARVPGLAHLYHLARLASRLLRASGKASAPPVGRIRRITQGTDAHPLAK